MLWQKQLKQFRTWQGGGVNLMSQCWMNSMKVENDITELQAKKQLHGVHERSHPQLHRSKVGIPKDL